MNSNAINDVSGQANPQAHKPSVGHFVIPPLEAFAITGSELVQSKAKDPQETPLEQPHGQVTPPQPPFAPQNNIASESVVSYEIVRSPAVARAGRGKRVLDYLNTVKKRTLMINRQFEEQGLPYRLSVFTKGNKAVYLDMATIDNNGAVIRHAIREITHDDFPTLMDDISSGKGLFIDDVPRRR